MAAHPVRPGQRDALGRFVEEIFGALPRSEQRRWADVYLRGLLTVPGRKSLQSLARTYSPSHTVSQSLQQFINCSTWDWSPLRHAVAGYAHTTAPAHAWTVATVAVPKRGTCSAGVQRRFVPDLGRTLNCQSAVALCLGTDAGVLPVDWRLQLDGPWAEDARKRSRARIPDRVGTEPAWAHVLEMTAGLSAQLPPAPVVSELSCVAEPGRLMAGLLEQELDFLLEADPDSTVMPLLRRTTGAPPQGVSRPARIIELARRAVAAPGPATPSARVPSATGHGREEQLSAYRFPVALPGVRQPLRMWIQRPAGRNTPSRIWLTNVTHARVDTVAQLIRHAVGRHDAMARLERDFGLADFEGRSYPGWHHHMTMVTAAHTYDRVTRHRTAPQPPSTDGATTPAPGTSARTPAEAVRAHRSGPYASRGETLLDDRAEERPAARFDESRTPGGVPWPRNRTRRPRPERAGSDRAGQGSGLASQYDSVSR
ncbi:transposase [Streptomyces sp. HNM0574]|uniref:IS701 family transposase n=1 Tax=Streptomyces sp. HNM0574 TaxID=2714954 RepID=UPI00146D86F1|nr:transposase [Streptomyces sp. HNM0574]NLU68701.1 transposase [Streptomyces sp. HNM0574]